MPTALAAWGNSIAMRIPRDVLSAAGLSGGDVVDVRINERGNIELVPSVACRTGVRRRRVTFDELFKDYQAGRSDSARPWPDDTLVGAEKDAWA
ncbi:MAG: AbrB/MazE/SpoVT family DNA-binding domain-containing protein [Coriobacteriales bacterium]|nr:AbrB/MazE/SpoVT family DNA-binding domain-containing protein [Coriobacteriales bacterium]